MGKSGALSDLAATRASGASCPAEGLSGVAKVEEAAPVHFAAVESVGGLSSYGFRISDAAVRDRKLAQLEGVFDTAVTKGVIAGNEKTTGSKQILENKEQQTDIDANLDIDPSFLSQTGETAEKSDGVFDDLLNLPTIDMTEVRARIARFFRTFSAPARSAPALSASGAAQESGGHLNLPAAIVSGLLDDLPSCSDLASGLSGVDFRVSYLTEVEDGDGEYAKLLEEVMGWPSNITAAASDAGGGRSSGDCAASRSIPVFTVEFRCPEVDHREAQALGVWIVSSLVVERISSLLAAAFDPSDPESRRVLLVPHVPAGWPLQALLKRSEICLKDRAAAVAVPGDCTVGGLGGAGGFTLAAAGHALLVSAVKAVNAPSPGKRFSFFDSFCASAARVRGLLAVVAAAVVGDDLNGDGCGGRHVSYVPARWLEVLRRPKFANAVGADALKRRLSTGDGACLAFVTGEAAYYAKWVVAFADEAMTQQLLPDDIVAAPPEAVWLLYRQGEQRPRPHQLPSEGGALAAPGPDPARKLVRATFAGRIFAGDAPEPELLGVKYV